MQETSAKQIAAVKASDSGNVGLLPRQPAGEDIIGPQTLANSHMKSRLPATPTQLADSFYLGHLENACGELYNYLKLMCCTVAYVSRS